MNGRAVKSCTMLAAQAQGAEITTIEGLAKDGELHPMQAAFRECHGLQCGFCTPGMVMSAVQLLADNPKATEEEIREALEGNICRCTGYHNIVKSIQFCQSGKTADDGLKEQRHGRHERTRRSEQSPIGQSVRRREDRRFLTGAGQYTDDVVLHGQTYGVFLRSPHAHARIRSIDLAAAKAAPGVVAIFTGADLAEAKVGGLPCGWLIHSKDGTPMKEPPHPVLAQGKVRHVGDQVALVVAETLLQAKDAAELIDVDYEELPAVIDISAAPTRSAPRCTTTCPNNVCYDWGHGDKAAVDAAFAKAAHVTKLDFVNNRLIPNAIEPRAANAALQPHRRELHALRREPEPARRAAADVRVRARPAGAQGARDRARRRRRLRLEDLPVPGETSRWSGRASASAGRSSGRPSAAKSFLTDAHGRDHVTHAELALDADGKFLALRVKTIANMGAYLSTFASCMPTILYATLLAGQYKTPAIYCEVKAVFTNTAPVDAYRGAGRPEATYVVERIVEQAAREMKMDPAEIRRQQLHHRRSRTRRRSA